MEAIEIWDPEILASKPPIEGFEAHPSNDIMHTMTDTQLHNVGGNSSAMES
jgi:hypothetical protein